MNTTSQVTADAIWLGDAQGRGAFLTITPKGELIAGPALSKDKATRDLFDCMAKAFPTFCNGVVQENGKLKAEVARLQKTQVESFAKIRHWQDRAEKAEAEVTRLINA